ncbi:hypothetical protein ID866_10327 [Astraeus odoratus]|nr:hypothetical protein ID866_10327 [Astraeus odoratus]
MSAPPMPLHIQTRSFLDIDIGNVSWPSLYNPLIDIAAGADAAAIQPGGNYLQAPSGKGAGAVSGGVGEESFPLEPRTSLHPFSAHILGSSSHQPPPTTGDPGQSRQRLNVRRTRLTFALVVFFAFIGLGIFSALLGAAVMGFVIAGVYKAGGFWVSTWIPFIWAVIHGLLGLLGIWPSVIEII